MPLLRSFQVHKHLNRIRKFLQQKQSPKLTYQFQDTLPKNPIPNIETTLASYSKYVEILLPDEEHKEFHRIFHHFREHQLEKIHNAFIEDSQQQSGPYFEGYWNDYFLGDRRPIALRDNGAVIFKSTFNSSASSSSAFYSQKVNLLSRVTRVVLSSLEFYEHLRNEELPPDTIRYPDVDPELYPRRRWFEFQNKFIDPRRNPSPSSSSSSLGVSDGIDFNSWRFQSALKFNGFGLNLNKTQVANHLGFTPRDMSEYKTLFSTARVPGLETDSIRSFPESNHIIIIRRGNLWKLEVFSEFGRGRKRIDESFLYSCLSEIYDDTTVDVGVGSLTTLNREEWRQWRKRLVEVSKENQTNVQLIESSIFVLCLDDIDGVTDDFTRGEILHGNSRNRWFDKSLSIIALKDGRIGLNFHKTWDGRAVSRLMNWISTSLRQSTPIPGTSFSSPPPSSYTTSSSSPSSSSSSSPNSSGYSSLIQNWSWFTPRSQPLKLKWFIPHDVEVKIKESDKNFNLKRRALTIRGITLEGIGKQYFKSHGLPPDFVVHLSLILAHKRLFDTIPTIKQYTMNSVYNKGRLNVIRPVSLEAIDFVYSFIGANKTTGDPSEQYKKLMAASRRHSQMLSQAHQGLSYDIHLNSLYHFLIKSLKQQQQQQIGQNKTRNGLGEEMGDIHEVGGGVGVSHIPLFFRHHSWKHFVYDNNRITSNSFINDELESGVCGPIQLDSFSFTYGMRTDSVYYCVSSYYSPNEVNEFLEQIVLATNEISSLLKTSFLTHKWII